MQCLNVKSLARDIAWWRTDDRISNKPAVALSENNMEVLLKFLSILYIATIFFFIFFATRSVYFFFSRDAQRKWTNGTTLICIISKVRNEVYMCVSECFFIFFLICARSKHKMKRTCDYLSPLLFFLYWFVMLLFLDDTTQLFLI